MISLSEIKQNSEQLAECTAKIEQMLAQLTVVEY
jgi:hypothetical protein